MGTFERMRHGPPRSDCILASLSLVSFQVKSTSSESSSRAWVRKARQALVRISVVAWMGGCAQQPPDDPNVLASYEDGEVTREELESAVLQLPPAQRRPDDGDFRSWYSALIRLVATEELLRRAALASGLDEAPEFTEQWEPARDQILVQELLQRQAADLEATAEELEAAYSRNIEQFQSPARRTVYHLFLRKQPGESRQQLVERISPQESCRRRA